MDAIEVKKTVTVRVKSEPSVKRKMKPRGKPFAGRNDPRVNLNGAPKRGESWREIIDSVGKMFAEEISAEVGNNDLGRAYRQLPRGIAMKRLVVMRVFAALMFEPTAGLWNPLMERVEGKVIQPISVSWLDKARAAGLSLEEAQGLYADMVEAARERLARIHADGGVGAGTDRSDSE